MNYLISQVTVEPMDNARPVLVFDGMNSFIRSWAAYPSMSAHGYQMGGCVGFLKTLRRLVYDIGPSAVYVAWEGGGSVRRRAIYAEYKLGRRPERLNRFYEGDIPDTEDNRRHQSIALVTMLGCAPVCQLYAADCEGDDVVAHLCTGPFRQQEKVIVSSDKDLYQLLDDRTRMYSLHRKTYVTKETVLEEFRVQSKHFAIAKALCGDAGDNVPGIKGVGFKTVAKLFPLLGTEDEVLLDDVIAYAHAHADEAKAYKRILEQEGDIRRNYRLVHLDGGMLSAHQQSLIDQTIANFVPRSNQIGLVRQLIKEGVNDFDVPGFLYAFNGIDGLQHGTGDDK